MEKDWLIVLHIDGIRPRACPRPRMAGHAYMPLDYQQLKVAIRDKAMAQGCRKLNGWLEVEVIAYFQTPKKQKDVRPLSGDVDNLGKTVLDALMGVIFDDDKFIARGTFEKRYSPTMEGYLVKVRMADSPEVNG